MSKFLKEFKEFAVKGNVVDMAVGIIIGGAFGKIVSSLVSDIIMPAVGLIVGNTNFTDWKWVLHQAVINEQTQEILAPELAITYGNFIKVILDFIIIAFSIFLMLKMMSKMKERSVADGKKLLKVLKVKKRGRRADKEAAAGEVPAVPENAAVASENAAVSPEEAAAGKEPVAAAPENVAVTPENAASGESPAETAAVPSAGAAAPSAEAALLAEIRDLLRAQQKQ